jgi:hypothetical protein
VSEGEDGRTPFQITCPSLPHNRRSENGNYWKNSDSPGHDAVMVDFEVLCEIRWGRLHAKEAGFSHRWRKALKPKCDGWLREYSSGDWGFVSDADSVRSYLTGYKETPIPDTTTRCHGNIRSTVNIWDK